MRKKEERRKISFAEVAKLYSPEEEELVQSKFGAAHSFTFARAPLKITQLARAKEHSDKQSTHIGTQAKAQAQTNN